MSRWPMRTAERNIVAPRREATELVRGGTAPQVRSTRLRGRRRRAVTPQPHITKARSPMANGRGVGIGVRGGPPSEPKLEQNRESGSRTMASADC